MNESSKTFIGTIPDKEESVRLAVLQALSRVAYAAPSAVPLLIGRLADESPALRHRTARLLGRMGSAARLALPALSAALEDRRASAHSSQGGAAEN